MSNSKTLPSPCIIPWTINAEIELRRLLPFCTPTDRSSWLVIQAHILPWWEFSTLQALFSNLGYVYLDVRPALELEEVGKVRGCINIPIVHARRVWNSQEGKKALTKEENPDFVRQVNALSLNTTPVSVCSLSWCQKIKRFQVMYALNSERA